MSSALPPPPQGHANPFVSWVKSHKVWSGVIGAFILLFVIGSFAPSEQASSVGSSGPQTTPTTVVPTPTSSVPSSPEPSQVTVPAVVGVSLQKAERKLERAGLVVEGRTKQFSHQAPGTVLRMSAQAGSKVNQGYAVTLFVAKPFPHVPSVTGLSADAAKSRLEHAGYQVAIAKQTSTESAGPVLGTR